MLPSLAVGGIALPAQAYIAPPSAPSSAPQNDTAKLVGQVYTVYFPGNGASFTGLGSELAESNKNTLEELSALLQANRNLNIRVTGYANPMRPTAREERNVLRPLSLRRAEAVAQVLEFYGIARSRMRINGAGGTSPLATYQNRNEWYRNRRVEITLIR